MTPTVIIGTSKPFVHEDSGSSLTPESKPESFPPPGFHLSGLHWLSLALSVYFPIIGMPAGAQNRSQCTHNIPYEGPITRFRCDLTHYPGSEATTYRQFIGLVFLLTFGVMDTTCQNPLARLTSLCLGSFFPVHRFPTGKL